MKILKLKFPSRMRIKLISFPCIKLSKRIFKHSDIPDLEETEVGFGTDLTFYARSTYFYENNKQMDIDVL